MTRIIFEPQITLMNTDFYIKHRTGVLDYMIFLIFFNHFNQINHCFFK